MSATKRYLEALQEMDEYQDGWRARARREFRVSPHRSGRPRDAWLAGFDAAEYELSPRKEP